MSGMSEVSEVPGMSGMSEVPGVSEGVKTQTRKLFLFPRWHWRSFAHPPYAVIVYVLGQASWVRYRPRTNRSFPRSRSSRRRHVVRLLATLHRGISHSSSDASV